MNKTIENKAGILLNEDSDTKENNYLSRGVSLYTDSPLSPERRGFLQKMSGLAVTTAFSGLIGATSLLGAKPADAEELDPLTPTNRAQQAFDLRTTAASYQQTLPIPTQTFSSDELSLPNYIANYSKGLPHNSLGEVDTVAYPKLRDAMKAGTPAAFEAIPLGVPNGKKLVNPQSALAFDQEGPDSHHLAIPAAPDFSSNLQAGEMVENYWMSLARDIHFSAYATDTSIIEPAASDLARLAYFKGPKTRATLFRNTFPGDSVGPYVSQFLLKTPSYGAQSIDPRVRTTQANLNYMTSYNDWLLVQKGGDTGLRDSFDPTRRYIRNGRDLGELVHNDVLFQHYLNALQVLLSIKAPFDAANPYLSYLKQDPFGTFGVPYIQSLVCAVATRALKAVWYQKWSVHRRIRPEAYSGRVHNKLTGQASYTFHPDLPSSPVLNRLFSSYGTYLLPMAYPEGCPLHPSYGSGHATVAGACATILKIFFNESTPISSLTTPQVASTDGLSLVNYTGADATNLTVGGELNKLASNIASGRNFAGVHWRSDMFESLYLGELIAIRFMREEKLTFNEAFAGFSLTQFNGLTVTI